MVLLVIAAYALAKPIATEEEDKLLLAEVRSAFNSLKYYEFCFLILMFDVNV